MQIGFIGLGIMGTPVCGYLQEAGHALFVPTRSDVPGEISDAGATRCENAREVAQRSDGAVTMVPDTPDTPDTPDVANVLFAENRVAEGLTAVSEALAFASKPGCDPAKVLQALMGGYASSRILEVHGERMTKRTFNPGFRIGLHQKDMNLALQGARTLGVSLPGTAQVAQLMQTCSAHGLGDMDHSALVCALEILADHQVAKA